MDKMNFKYLYGPVYSWRLGHSLGIDPISTKEKICNFDCIYCQLGKTSRFTEERKIFIPTDELIKEIKSLPPAQIDYFTFSGRGEPTLAQNLGDMIRALRKVRKEKIAVITNSSLMHNRKVRDDLLLADFVLAKLDACSEETFKSVDRAVHTARFDLMVDGIKDFKTLFRGKLALQIMLIDQNKKFADKIAAVARTINAQEVELNTPLRPSLARPLSKNELYALRDVHFKNLPVVTVYDKPAVNIASFNERDTMRRHGNFRNKTTKEDYL